MERRFKSYTTYSIGCALVWAVILAVVQATASEEKKDRIKIYFFGWAIGWLSATIARAVYPPSRSHRTTGAPS